MLLAVITLLSALTISAVAGFFSIVGLAQLFSGAFWGVVVMGIALEIGKLVAATWLHTHWNNPLVSIFHKTYMTVAVIVVMFITSLGIFGYLSKAHIDQTAPIQAELTNIKNIKDQLDFKKQQLEDLNKQLVDLNKLLIPGESNPRLERQLANITREITKVRKDIDDLSKKLQENQVTVNTSDVKLGPVKYLAEIVYGDAETNADRAVQMMIIIIMLVFDPLAVAMVLGATISFQIARNSSTKNQMVTINIGNNLQPVTDNGPDTNVVNEVGQPQIHNPRSWP